MNTSLLISLLGTLQGILISFFFFVKSRGRVATLMFGLYVFIFSLGLLEEWLLQQKLNLAGNIFLAFVSNSAFLYGPLLYLFVYFLTTNTKRFKNIHILHFLLFGTAFITRMAIILKDGNDVKNADGMGELIAFELLVIQILLCNIYAIKRLDRYQHSILQTWSNIDQKDLSWLRRLLFLITGIYGFSFLLTHLLLFGIDDVTPYYLLVQVSITVSIYIMSYMVLFRSSLFIPEIKRSMGNSVVEEENEIEKPELLRYRKSGLKPEQARKYLGELQCLMDKEKPFKNPDLTIYTLAQQLGISRNHLTQVLNEELKLSFFEFINTYRIEEAKLLLLHPDFAHLNLPGIAVEAGYRSKTTFFSNFRKITGHTPQEWVRLQKETGLPPEMA
jgi:AraC-like DNA-binding protein